jgi:regulator of nucleoside diphosphate kinase
MYTQLPQIYISRSERKRLLKLASDAYAHKERTAPFLSAELRRAQFCAPEKLPPAVVKVGDRVRYQLDWGPASAPCELVYPEDFTGGSGQISLLSPIGVALLGLPVGARMPVFIPNEGFRTLGPVDVL